MRLEQIILWISRGKSGVVTLLNGGMLQYLNENSETTFVITGYSDSQITAVGQTHGKEMILTPVSTAALQQAKERNDWPLLLIIKHRPWICLRES